MTAPRLCQSCGITPKGAASDKARTSPAGRVHLIFSNGATACGKRPSVKWTRP